MLTRQRDATARAWSWERHLCAPLPSHGAHHASKHNGPVRWRGRLLAAEAAPNEWGAQVGQGSGRSLLSWIAVAARIFLLIQAMRSTSERVESSFVSRWEARRCTRRRRRIFVVTGRFHPAPSLRSFIDIPAAPCSSCPSLGVRVAWCRRASEQRKLTPQLLVVMGAACHELLKHRHHDIILAHSTSRRLPGSPVGCMSYKVSTLAMQATRVFSLLTPSL